MKFLFAFFLSISTLTLVGQSVLKGKVINEKTKEALAFASIVIKDHGRGTTTDIDGRFQLSISESHHEIIITHIGFESRTVKIVETSSLLVIRLREKSTELAEVVVRPEDNPAFRIIRAATKNKPIHDPENLPSFSYNSYNKLYSTLLDPDSTPISDDIDSARFRKYIRDNHLFIHESYTERKYLKPNHNKETVLGNHLSGIKDPFFTFIATDLQPFSFYNDFIKLFNKDYLSPLSPGSTNKYDFILLDTLYQGSDSIYAISFEPLPGKIFNALKGQLYISTDGFAIESVHAQPADDKVLVESLIQQKYEKINGHWFPVQLNSELRFKQPAFGPLKLKYVSRSYITNIQIGNELSEKDFTIANVEFAPHANRRDSAFWNANRIGEFEKKEENTFNVLDSAGERMVAFQAAFKLLEGLYVGRFKAGAFYIPVEHLIQFNQYEAARVGFGFQTGERISRRFGLEGYFGYGFKDVAFKYGGAFLINVSEKKEANFKFSYKQDLAEPGRPTFVKSAIATRVQESLRNWMTTRMDSVEQMRLEFAMLPFHSSQLVLFGQQQKTNPAYAYSFAHPDDIAKTTFSTFEAGFQWRFAPKETYVKIGQSQVVTKLTYPLINLSLTRSFSGFMEGEYDFTKFEMRVDHQFITRALGKTTLQLDGGIMDKSVPYPFLFYGKGSKYDESFLNVIVAYNYFQTMGLYEFISDRYAYLFLNQYIGRISGNKSKYFRPELSLIHSMGIGTLTNKEFHQGITFNTMEKGFIESGLIIANLLRVNYFNFAYLGVGIGGFYRYGYYRLPHEDDNFAGKLIISFSF